MEFLLIIKGVDSCQLGGTEKNKTKPSDYENKNDDYKKINEDNGKRNVREGNGRSEERNEIIMKVKWGRE